MDIQNQISGELYELVPTGPSVAFRPTVVGRKRVLIGRGHHCDVIVLDASVSGIHAVLEIGVNGISLFDLNSTNGTFVNGNKIVSQKIQLGDKLRFGLIEIQLRKYIPENVLPPALDLLAPGNQLNSNFLPTPPVIPFSEVAVSSERPGLPISAKVEKGGDGHNYVSYPLSLDPKAEFSEYIFEDADEIYPIFNYDIEDAAIEVVILFNDSVISVDYLPAKTASYYLVGFDPKEQIELVEFPYLGRGDKFEFVKIKGSTIDIFMPPGFSLLHLQSMGKIEQRAKVNSSVVGLGEEEILVLNKDFLQIFVRKTPSPPEVKAAPFLQRDEGLKRLLFLMISLAISFSVGVNLVSVDEEIEQEKVPDRVATVLFKQQTYRPEKPNPIPIEKPQEKIEDQKIKTQIPLTPNEQKLTGKTFDSPINNQPQTTTQEGMSPEAKSEETPKLATTKNPKPEKIKSNFVAPKRTDNIGGRPDGGAKQEKSASSVSEIANSQGAVETYKSTDFSTNLSSLMAKGGGKTKSSDTSSSAQGGGQGGDLGMTEKISGGSPNSAVQRASVEQNVGSLTGVASGKLAASKGAEGLIDKKTVLTAGFPAQTVVLGYDPDIIRRILQENMTHFRRCYQSELDTTFNKLSGNIDLNFNIGASGHVSQAGVGNKSKFPPALINCVVNVLRGLVFPAPQGGGTVEVMQPMNFYPRN